MATRARIGIQLDDNSVLSVYHHWDGYPQWLGRILKTHYNTREQVAELIDGGDMSSCWSDSIWGENLSEGKYAPEYYSARGEDCPPRLDTIFDFLDKNNNEEYAYIWTVNNEWKAFDMNAFNDAKPESVEIPEGALAV